MATFCQPLLVDVPYFTPAIITSHEAPVIGLACLCFQFVRKIEENERSDKRRQAGNLDGKSSVVADCRSLSFEHSQKDLCISGQERCE